MQILHRVGLVLLAAISVAYWRVQVADGATYRERADHNRLRKLAIEAPRGLILDRGGVPLVENVPHYRLYLDRTRVDDLDATLQHAACILGIEAGALAAEVEARRGVPRFRPIPLADDLSLQDVSRFAVHQLEHPEFEVQVEEHRLYRYAHQTAHLLGYLGEVSEEQLAREDSGYRPGELVGRKGLERIYEGVLRGIQGEQVVVVDSRGRVIEEYDRQPARPGEDLHLELDLGLQQEAARLLEGKVGSIVALDPRDGAIRAMASSPSFDPNLFAHGISSADWRRLVEDPDSPLQNRAAQNAYPPGSVFKLAMAVAALQTGVLDPSETVYCRGYSVIYDHRYRCWKRSGHGRVDLEAALAESCNVYFHQLGKRLEIDEIARFARRFGLGTTTGVDLAGERSGLVPDSRWSHERRGTPWYPGETISVATGQGPLQVTPLQIAVLAAAFANGGQKIHPHLASGVPVPEPRDLEIAPEVLDTVRRGMWAVVNDRDGSGRSARFDDSSDDPRLREIEIAGKTGTAQVVTQETWTKNEELPPELRDHAWFASFAPYDDPELVVVVFVEHGGGGSTTAAPLARALYAKHFQSHLAHRPAS